MTTPITPEVPTTETVVVPPVETPPVTTPEPVVTDWEKEAEKYKHFMRENEKQKNAALAELDKLKQSQMTDAERAIEEAKAAGRKEGTTASVTRLVKAEIKAAAATAGVEFPKELEKHLTFTNFADADGEPDEIAIQALVASLKPSNEYAQGLGLGRTGGNAEPTVDYSPQAIADRVFKKNPY